MTATILPLIIDILQLIHTIYNVRVYKHYIMRLLRYKNRALDTFPVYIVSILNILILPSYSAYFFVIDAIYSNITVFFLIT